MAISLGNRAKMSTSTTGTGTITLGSASTGYQTFANAGITNGQTVRYAIEDGSNFEIGSGTYTASGTTLTRSVTESSNSDNAISLSGTANVFVTATVADIFINDGASALTTTGLITSGTLDVNGASQFDGAVSVGVDDTGHDVKFFGDAASAYMLWDASADDLILGGAAGLIVPNGQFTLESTAVTTTGTEINLIDGGTARGTTAVASGDGILINDAGTMRMTNVDTVSTYFAGHSVGGGNIVTVGALNAGSITSGFGAINNGSSNITTTGVGTFASLDISGNIDVDGTANLDIVDIDGAVDIATTALVTGVLTTTATQVATGGITSGSNIVSDTDSTDDLGTTGVRWANLFVDAITATDQITATGFTGTLDGILGSGAAAAATVTTLDTSGAVNLNLVTDSTSSTSGALIIDGGVGIAKKLFVGTDLDVDGTTNLDAVDIDGAVQLDATLTVGVDDTGYDVKFFGDTASAFMQWDASADDLILGGAAGLVLPKDKLTIDSTAVTTTAAELNKLDGAGTLKQAGLETIWVPATAMYPATTNGSSALTQVETTALRPDLMVLDFAAAADDFAQFSIGFPKSWNEGTVTFQVFWTPSNTNTDNCIWSLQGVSVADGATIDVAYGTAVSVTDAGIGTVEDQQVSPVSWAVTITNAAVDTQTYFQIFRDGNAAGDDFSGVARLLGVKIFFTTDAANDA